MKQKKKTLLLSVLVIVAVALIGLAVYIFSNQLKIEFEENKQIELNEKIDNYQLIKTIENGKILSEKAYIDTQTTGEKRIEITVKPTLGSKKTFTFSVFVVDREGPKITFADHLKTDLGKEIDLLKDVSATDNSGEKITVSVEGDYDIHKIGDYNLKYVAIDSSQNKTEEEFVLSVEDKESPVITFTYYLETVVGNEMDLLAGVSATDNSGEEITVSVEGDYDINTPGEYALKYVAVDSSMNKAEEDFILNVAEEYVPPEEIINFTTSKGFHGVIRDGVTYIEGYLVANKTYSLPQNYGYGLTDETMSAFRAMAAAAKEDGLNIYISSGFRSYSTQNWLYNNYVSRDGVEKADTYSARAGHSEHQSGLAFDVNEISDAFIGTPEALWLDENCYKYGFILRYINGKSDETGYKYEPWHFRYVGNELAEILYNNGDWITVEDYFGITSEYGAPTT